MNNKPNNIYKAIGKLTALSIVIVLPLIIIFYYEAWNLQLRGFEVIKKDLFQNMRNLQDRKRTNEKLLSQITKEINQIATQNSYQTSIHHQIANIIEENIKITMPKKAYFKSNIIINILFNKSPQFQEQQLQHQFHRQFKALLDDYFIDFSIKIWKKGMNINEMSNSIILIIHQLKMEYFQENTALKIRKGDFRDDIYLRQISKQLNNMPSLSQCRFSNIECIQKTIILFNHKDDKKGGYWQIDRQIYIVDEFDSTTYFNIACDIFDITSIIQLQQILNNKTIPKQLLSLLQQRQQIKQLEKALTYLSFIFEPNSFSFSLLLQKLQRNPDEALRYLKNGEFISPYLHTQKQLLVIKDLLQWIRFPLSKQLQASIIIDSRIGQIDLFPNDFKIGVYLPIFVLFLYPLILKLKQLLTYLISKS